MYSLVRSLRTALRALRRNILRSALTCLGIIIAVAAVIAMVEIGQGSNVQIQKTISSMGAALLIVFPNAASNSGVNLGAGTGITLSPADSAAIATECPAVRGCAPVVRARGQVIHGDLNWSPNSIIGSTPAYFDVHEWTDYSAGASFTDEDVQDANQVCLIGQTVADNLFGEDSPLGQSVRLNGVNLKVVGVLSQKGANMFGSDQDDIVVAPWTTIKYRVNGSGGTSGGHGNVATLGTANAPSAAFPAGGLPAYPPAGAAAALDTPMIVRFTNVDNLIIGARNLAAIPEAMQEITLLLRERHHISGGPDDEDFVVRDLTEIGNALTSTSRLMTQLLLVVATISLVVGGVGIMNIMMVSVTERTREIGLRMAVGAKGKDILRQFLVEAVVLCLIGGLLGLGVGRLSSFAVTTFLHWPVHTSISAAVAALGVSATVGVIFGYYPALKASRMDPIEALRYE
jgi:ABC-type antimicrobial peptide transport system permease subunit